MKKLIRFSKPYDKNVFKIKQNFYFNNKKNLDSILKINNIYKKQKKEKMSN